MGIRILVVDDVLDAREAIGMLLKLDGHEVLLAEDGEKAVRSALQHRPDLIFMDIAMPVMNGIVATQHLKQAPETRDIPVIAVSAYVDDPIWRQRALDAGMAGFLSKPMNYELMQTMVASVSTR